MSKLDRKNFLDAQDPEELPKFFLITRENAVLTLTGSIRIHITGRIQDYIDKNIPELQSMGNEVAEISSHTGEIIFLVVFVLIHMWLTSHTRYKPVFALGGLFLTMPTAILAKIQQDVVSRLLHMSEQTQDLEMQLGVGVIMYGISLGLAGAFNKRVIDSES